METSALFTTHEVSSFGELHALVQPLAARGHGPFRQHAFRGQADAAWSLLPSFARVLREAAASEPLPASWEMFERTLVLLLQTKAHLYRPLLSLVRGEESALLDWLVLGRHHGLPTRLLDWTYSPYVAAWNACASAPRTDGTLWCVSVEHVNAPDDVKALMHRESDNLRRIVAGEQPAKPLLFFLPHVHNERSAAQQGLFSIAADGLADHLDLLRAEVRRYEGQVDEPLVRRVVVPARLKGEFLRALRAMNVTAESLEPDLDGYCRELGLVLRDHPIELARQKAEAGAWLRRHRLR